MDQMVKMIPEFYKGKTVLVTGHTGFKGTWMCMVLSRLGAKVIGYSLGPPTNPSLFELSGIESEIVSVMGDVRDYKRLLETFEKYTPEIVIHMAAQPLVGEGYKNPAYTYETNVMGTVNVLEAIRKTTCVRSFLNVTTDKVYRNNEWLRGYREDDELDGYDPYSNSKSCSELVTKCYSRSFPRNNLAISTARAGNVIGGGDFSDNRIIPDCMRAVIDGTKIVLRNPHSIRPYQHVLEPVCAYLMIAAKQYDDHSYSGSYNIGPELESCVDNETMVKLFCERYGDGLSYDIQINKDAPHEACYLKLDNSKIKSVFGWNPVWDIGEAVGKTIEWIRSYVGLKSIRETMLSQIDTYVENLDWW